MNNPIDKQIMNIIRKYTRIIYRKLNYSMDTEDIQQELLLGVISALKKYSVKKGNIYVYIYGVIRTSTAFILRGQYAQKRKTWLYTTSEYIGDTTKPEETDIRQKIFINSIMAKLPAGLRQDVLDIEHRLSAKQIKLIKKIAIAKGGQFMNISCLEVLTPQEIAKLDERDLCDLLQKVEQTQDWVKKIREKLKNGIIAKYHNQAIEELHNHQKDFGRVHWNIGQHTISVEIPKKVKWEQETLARIYEKMDKDVRNEIFSVVYSIPEKAYNQLTPNVQETMNAARIVQPGNISVNIEVTHADNNSK